MAKYRTRVCEIEAVEFTHNNFDDIKEFTNNIAVNFKVNEDGKSQFDIPTMEGVMIATEGDYIIKGTEGEFYPCKPTVFIKKYETI